MGLFRFILGVLGVLLVIGSFSSFIPLFFLGGIATGNVAFAFGFPIFLMIIGAAMVYFGFYYTESKRTRKDNSIEVLKWGVVFTVSVLLSNYIINRLMMVNELVNILLTAIISYIVVQIVRSHDSEFSFKWSVFYFLVYTVIVWIVQRFITPNVFFQNNIFLSIVTGFAIAGVVIILQKSNFKYNSAKWIIPILIIFMIVANLESLSLSNITRTIDTSSNTSELPKNKLLCPTSITNTSIVRKLSDFDSQSTGLALSKYLDASVWKIESNIRSCYKGKYTGQYPNWLYCDDMIVSRWETSDSGTISYRWYTAVTAEWKPNDSFGSEYVLNDFSCENGQKLTVNKDTTNYYVYVSRDGTEIKVQY